MAHFLHKFFGFMHKHGWLTFGLLAMLSFAFSIIGFMSTAETPYTFEPWMLVQALTQSFADLPGDEHAWPIVGKVLWIITFASAAFSLFLKDWSNKQLFKSIQENKHTAILGVGKLSHNYIDKLDPNTTVILNNNENIKSERYKDRFAIEDISYENIENSLNISHMRKAIINTQDDKNNINLAFHIINTYLKEDYTHPLRLIVRIENRELNALFMSNSLFKGNEFKDTKIELKTYSFFEECAIKLFQDNFIDGDDNTIIDSNDEYAVVIAGDGQLANKIIYEAAKIAHLPNQNILNLYLVANNPEDVKKSIIKSYPNIEKIPTLRIHTKQLDYKTLEYYTDGVWDTNNLTNVILCYDDEDINLEIASSMQDKTFLRKTESKTKVLFGVFDQGNISKQIDKDKNDDGFSRFESFGNAKDILTIENIFDDKNHMIAKLINYTYDLLVNEDYEAPYKSDAFFNYNAAPARIDLAWYKKVFTDKTSSLAQAKHIPIKLKTLGLKYEKASYKTTKELLKLNRAMIDSKFDTTYVGNYPFPDNFEDTLFDKMIRLEHNRWNAYHYLNGWEVADYNLDQTSKATREEEKEHKKMKSIKKHNCLRPVDEFSLNFSHKDRLIQLIEWDIYAFMYIPNYLAESGYEIIEK